jgi:uncharacterized repeat protein (TIGR01451 family)
MLAAVLSMAYVSATPAQLPPSELLIDKSAGPEPVIPGNLITYTMTAENNGEIDVLNMKITDPLPAETVFISAVASAGATLTTPAVGANGTVTSVWDAAGGTSGGLTPPDGTRTLTIVGRVCPETGCVDIVDTATVDSDSPDVPDDDTTTTQATPQSNLSISKTGPAEQVLAGRSFTFSLLVANGGPSNSPTTRVVDTLPPGFVATGTQSTIPGTTCNISADGRTITCGFALGAANQCATTLVTSGTLTIEVTVAPETDAGTYTNTATIGISGPCGTDPNTTNNTATADVRVVGPAGAPVASPLGLAMLAIALGAAGAWMLHRRRLQ